MILKRSSTEKTSKSKKHKKMSKKKKLIIAAIVLCLVIGIYLFVTGNKKNNEQQNYIEVQAKIGNITETIRQSGVVEPYERYEITSLVRGEIISSPFEEGDQVNEGDTLYQIDDEDAQLTMEKAQMSMDDANDNVSKLNIYAQASGRLSDFSLEVGNSVNGGIIGNIINTDTLSVDIPFSLDDFDKISVGDDVTITSALYMTSLPGKVSHKYYANAETGSDSSILRNIEIELENPGALAENTTFAATVHTVYGDVSSSGSGTIGRGNISQVRAEVNGTVSYVGFKNGDYVSKGDLILSLENNSVVNAQKTARLNVKSTQKTLDNYNITSPISGTVITKNSKAGDNIDSTNAQKIMMVVADMSKMKFTINVDELDISDIHLGQTAIVSADAFPDKMFEAKVSAIASEGVSTGDGVTTYLIELTIDNPGELKSGMNVNANILINEANNAVVIPEDALMSVRGKSANVLVKTGKKSVNNSGQNSPSGGPANNIPEGCEMRRVEIGISDGMNVQIVSGLSEGEIVVYAPPSSGSSNPFGAMMGGMMRGGGAPAGGFGGNSGGNRSRGTSGNR